MGDRFCAECDPLQDGGDSPLDGPPDSDLVSPLDLLELGPLEGVDETMPRPRFAGMFAAFASQFGLQELPLG